MRKLTVVMLTLAALVMSLTATGAEKKAWTIAPAPKELPDISMEWGKVLDKALLEFSLENHRWWYEKADDECRILVQVAYGLLQSDNFYWGAEFNETLKKFYNSPRHLRIMYRWALPSVRQVFRQLPRKERITYINILRHAKKYAQSYNHKQEEAYLRKLKEDYNEYQFAIRGPDDKKDNPYRKVEAFIFRRVRDGMSIREIRKWIKVGIRDLRPLVKKK